MASGVFNVALGRINEYPTRVDGNDPANSALVVVLCTGTETDGNLKDVDTLTAALALAIDEATATNYARKVLTDTDIGAITTDDTGDRQYFDMADLTWSSLGGGVNNTLTRLLVCYDSDTTSGTDTNIIPIAYYDFAVATNGGDIVASINASGLFSATGA